MPRTYCCPYYKWDDGKTVHCEGGKIGCGSEECREHYIRTYCADPKGWQGCSVALAMSEKERT